MTPVFTTARGTLSLPRLRLAGQPSGRSALAALVAALVIGILGMHALASNGTHATTTASAAMTGMTGMTSLEEAPITAGDRHDGHAYAAATHPSVAASETTVDLGSGSGHDMTSMVMLCVVMLAAAAMTLLVLLVAGILRPLLPAAFRPAAVPAKAMQWVRSTGPPDEWQFPVIRC